MDIKPELILGIIGAITGSLALIIDFFNYKFYMPKLILKPLKNSYFLDKENVKEITNYNSKRIAIISLKISNSSAHPITIDEVFIKNFQNIIKHYNDFKITVPQIQIGNNPKTYTYINPEKIATLPLRMEPFDTQYVSFRFPFFDDCNLTFKLVFVTPRKNYSVKVNLLEYHELVLSRYPKSQGK
mgnify:CR=1 FL=1